MYRKSVLLMIICAVLIVQPTFAAEKKTFSIAASEYPSWSVFIVAGLKKIDGQPMINPKKGKTGLIEDKWGVDLEVRYPDYEGCLMQYGNGQCGTPGGSGRTVFRVIGNQVGNGSLSQHGLGGRYILQPVCP